MDSCAGVTAATGAGKQGLQEHVVVGWYRFIVGDQLFSWCKRTLEIGLPGQPSGWLLALHLLELAAFFF